MSISSSKSYSKCPSPKDGSIVIALSLPLPPPINKDKLALNICIFTLTHIWKLEFKLGINQKHPFK